VQCRARFALTRWRALMCRLLAAALRVPADLVRQGLAHWQRRPVSDAVMRRRLAAAGLAFAEQPHPLVSVLIAMYGRPELTLDALHALMTTAAEVPI
jgi:hypothetical protein